MVVDANLLRGGLDGLFYEVDKVRWAQFAQRLQGLGACLDGRVELVLVYPVQASAYAHMMCMSY